MTFFLPLLFIICISGTVALLSKQRFELTLPLSLMLVTLIVFIASFCGQMQLGFILAIIFALVFPVLIVFYLIRKRALPLNTKNFFTPGFIIFLCLYLIIFILNYDRAFTSWDEFSHWGPMVKEMLRLNKLYSVAESVLSVHKDYPPAVPLFETIWCKLCGGYKETYLYRSLQTLMLSLYFPALVKFDWKRTPSFFFKMLLILMAVLLVNLVVIAGEAGFYTTIYIDCLLGLMLAYCVSLILFEQRIRKFSIFNLTVALTFLLLTKQMGIMFFLLILAIFVVNIFMVQRDSSFGHQNQQLNKRTTLPLVAGFLGIAVIPYAAMTIWNKYASFHEITRQFNISDIHITQLPGIALGTAGEVFQHEALNNFLKAFLNDTFVDRPLAFTYWQLLFVAAIIFFVVARYGKDVFRKNQIHAVNIMLCLGALAYAAGMMLLYVFCFGSYEGPILASYVRYLNTYWFALCALAMMLFLYIEGHREAVAKKASFLNVGFVVVLMLVLCMNSAKAHELVPAVRGIGAGASYAKDVALIKEETSSTAKVMVISKETDGFDYYVLRYLISPKDLQRFDYGFIIGDNEMDLNDCDYLYIKDIDDAFISDYSSFFPAGTDIEANQIYQIKKQSDGNISLRLID